MVLELLMEARENLEKEFNYLLKGHSEYFEYKKKPYNWKGSHYIERNLKKKVLRSPGALGYLKSWENIIIYAIKNKLQQIENKNRKKPIFPFQNINEFVPKVYDGSNKNLLQ